MYLEVPVNVVFHMNGVYVGAGPYAAFGLSGKEKYTDSSNPSNNVDKDVKFGSSNTDDLKRTDFGLNVLAGYQLTNGVNFGVGYGLGLSNHSNDNTVTAKNKVFSISVGYSF